MRYLPTTVVAIIVGLVVYLVQESRLKSLRGELARADASTKDEPEKSRRLSLSAPVADSNSVISSRKEVTERPGKENDEKGDKPLRSMSEVLQTDAGRAMIKQGIEAGLPMIYGDFINSLGLNDEELKYFQELLTKRILDQQQLGMKWVQADEEGRASLAVEMEKLAEDSSVKIDEFLQNEEDAVSFKRYEQQLPERRQMRGIRNTLSDEPLTPEVEERLVDALYQARLNSGEGNGSDEENWEKLVETGDFRVIKERWRATDVEIAKNIPDVLTPTQSEAFLDYWKTARTMQAAEYKMGMQMMGIDK
tara:strand:- start:2077 stop:2997 length:921 start_codon:yes stop_codon:yes gene_type:complete